MSGISLRIDLYMTCEDQVFIANVMVINLTWKIVATNVMNQPDIAIAELNTIVKICKYRRLHDKHHFILMAMELRLDVIWIVSSGNVLIFSTINDQKVIYPCLFTFNFSNSVFILLLNVF
jgi:hypothetical protein